MCKHAALLTATLALAVAGCASSSADAPAASAIAVVSEEIAPSASPTPHAEPDATGESEQASSGAPRSGPGSYITLDEYDADKSAYASTDVVLFFNVEWCPTCKVARDNIESSLASIPSDLTIVIVDFETADDLRRKYGVTYQHTFVQVDTDGNELAKWSGSVTTDAIAQKTV